MMQSTSIPHPAQDTGVSGANRAARDEHLRQALASDKLPINTRTTEKPEHLTLVYLLAAGRTRTEIAKITGMAVATVNDIAKQPWFRQRLKEVTEANGIDMVKAYLHGEVLPSLEILREVRDNPDERGATRIAAANSILDRFMGKPTVHVESQTNLNIHSAADAKDQVQSELEKVDAELRRLGVAASQPRAN